MHVCMYVFMCIYIYICMHMLYMYVSCGGVRNMWYLHLDVFASMNIQYMYAALRYVLLCDARYRSAMQYHATYAWLRMAVCMENVFVCIYT